MPVCITTKREGKFFKLDVSAYDFIEGWLKSISLRVHLGIYWLVEWFEKGFLEVLLMVNLGLSGSICRYILYEFSFFSFSSRKLREKY